MWQQIEANKRKSVILITVMAFLLVGVGYAGAFCYLGADYALLGVFASFLLWLLLLLVSYFQGDNIFLAMNNARKISPDDNKRLYNIVEEMSIASGMPKVPDIYIIDEAAPNAFAVGKKPETASVAVTVGLLEKLNRDELQGVIAHEIAHIKNRDTLYMLFASIMLSAIVLMAELFVRVRFRSARGRSSSSNGGLIEVAFFIACLALMIFAPLVARLVYYSLSRKREYLADACAAQFTRYPAGLASALAKISGTSIKLKCANKFSAPMYIVNPLAFNSKLKKLNDLTSTHPSTASRIEILYKMSGADIVAYQEAYSEVQGQKGGRLFKKSMLDGVQPLGIVAGSAEVNETAVSQVDEKVSRRREVEDMMWQMSGYAFVQCECGTKIKAPECYKNQIIPCPHCQKELHIK